MTASAVLMASSAARADVTMNSVRVAGTDTVALAKFYQSAFGMFEVNRIDVPGGPEIFVNFGASAEAAKANKGLPDRPHAPRLGCSEGSDRARPLTADSSVFVEAGLLDPPEISTEATDHHGATGTRSKRKTSAGGRTS